jgi:prefoldin alpha subunit
MDSEYLMKMQMIEQEATKLDQQLQMMDQQIQELIAIKASIEAISTTKEKEILASLGKGIFIKAEIKSQDLMVNTGKDIFIKKTPSETMQIIDSQVKRLEAGKEEFTNKIIELQSQMQVLMEYMNKENKHNKEHAHGCGDEACECEEPCEDCECKHEHKKK